jgi:hypothetical protein
MKGTIVAMGTGFHDDYVIHLRGVGLIMPVQKHLFDSNYLKHYLHCNPKEYYLRSCLRFFRDTNSAQYESVNDAVSGRNLDSYYTPPEIKGEIDLSDRDIVRCKDLVKRVRDNDPRRLYLQKEIMVECGRLLDTIYSECTSQWTADSNPMMDLLLSEDMVLSLGARQIKQFYGKLPKHIVDSAIATARNRRH